MAEISLKLFQDSVSEKKAVDDNVCTFAVLDRSTTARPMLFVSTKSDDSRLGKLPKWEITLPGGKGSIKRFNVSLSREDFFQQIKSLFPGDKVFWAS